MAADRSQDDTPRPAATGGAAGAQVDHFAGRLLAVARARLDPRLQTKVDASDVVQSVFRTYFRRAARGDFVATDPDSLLALLVRITIRKCCQQADHFLAARRDVRRESNHDANSDNLPVPSADPMPEEEAALRETIEWLRLQLGSPRKQQILDLSLEGYGIMEISAKLGYYERGVERVRAEIKDLLLQLH
jgi:DNA-directed RNA polymerase specialized sigma24 family protein